MLPLRRVRHRARRTPLRPGRGHRRGRKPAASGEVQRGGGAVRGIGLDFGTTNSAMAVADDSGDARFALFQTPEGETPAFRSVLFFGREDETVPTECTAGSEAISRYLETDESRPPRREPKASEVPEPERKRSASARPGRARSLTQELPAGEVLGG